MSVTQLSAGQPFFFLPFPQYSSGLNVIDSNDFSTYNALEVQVERRLTNGISCQVGYTWSKSLDTRSFDPTLTVVGTGNASTASDTPFDINNRRLNYAPSDFDRRHVLQSNWVVELALRQGQALARQRLGQRWERIIGGWEFTGYLRLTSGRPFTVFAGTNTVSNVNQSTANCTGCSRGDGSPFLDPANGLIWYFDANERAKFSAPGRRTNSGIPGATSSSARTTSSWIRRCSSGFRSANGSSSEFRGDATNLTNSVMFGNPTTDITSSIFGRIRNTVTSSSRKIQLGAKIHF